MLLLLENNNCATLENRDGPVDVLEQHSLGCSWVGSTATGTAIPISISFCFFLTTDELGLAILDYISNITPCIAGTTATTAAVLPRM